MMGATEEAIAAVADALHLLTVTQRALFIAARLATSRPEWVAACAAEKLDLADLERRLGV